MLMDQVGRFYIDIDQKMKLYKDELKDHFDLVSEQNRYDIRDMYKDKISLIDDKTHNHERRIQTLETKKY